MVEISELVSKGKGYLENGQYSEALGCFEQALLLKQTDPELWNFKAVSLRSILIHVTKTHLDTS
jgi:Flp pilus assembly protein TadD